MVIPTPLADLFGLPKGAPVSIGGAGGGALGHHTTVEITLGSYHDTVDAVVEPCRDVLVGLPIIKRLCGTGGQLVIDFGRNEIRTMPSSSDVDIVVTTIMQSLGEAWRLGDDHVKSLVHGAADMNRRLLASLAMGELVDLPEGYAGLRKSDGTIV